MQSKIKQITLLDGKQIFYPSDEEVAKLYENTKEVIVEETLSRAEFELRMASEAVFTDALISGIGIARIEPKEYLEPEGYWYCKACRTLHRADHICIKLSDHALQHKII